MGTAFNPGLIVTRQAKIRKIRRLPIKGEVLVKVGDKVTPEQIVARAYLPGELHTVRINDILNIEPFEVKDTLKVKEGDNVKKGDILAETKTFFGLFKSKCTSPFDGKIEYFSPVTGHLGLRKPSIPVEVNAYIQGKVVDTIENEAAIIETNGSLIQGIFGIGGETHGILKVLATSNDEKVSIDKITDDVDGKILVCGSIVTSQFLELASKKGAKGIIVGGIEDEDITKYLGYSIGVAVTGHEQIPTTIILTEGFGEIPIAKRTFELLLSLDGKKASINGATQIRAGAIRPEIIVPSEEEYEEVKVSIDESHKLEIGTRIRLIRVPYFGLLGRVKSLPEEPVEIETKSKVRVLEAILDDGRVVVVPRANVEIIKE
jgi:hypothetical protein